MKKSFLILIFSMISILSCLGRNVYTGTATYTAYTTQDGKYSNSGYCDFPIIIDLENEKVIVYLNKPNTFKLGNIIEASINESSISWIATDCNNNLGKLSMVVLEETNQIVLMIEMNYKLIFIIDL